MRFALPCLGQSMVYYWACILWFSVLSGKGRGSRGEWFVLRLRNRRSDSRLANSTSAIRNRNNTVSSATLLSLTSGYQRSTPNVSPVVFGGMGQHYYQTTRDTPSSIGHVRYQHSGRHSQDAPALTAPTLTHLDSSGRASMVSISSKIVTTRRATATGRIYLPSTAYDILAQSPGSFKKGDVLGTARIAGIMAGKRTSELIPLCHPIGLTDLKVKFKLEAATRDLPADMGKNGGYVCVQAVAECEGKTGVEVSQKVVDAVSTADSGYYRWRH